MDLQFALTDGVDTNNKRRLVMGAADGSAVMVVDNSVLFAGEVRADVVTLANFDLQDRLESMHARPGVGDRNVVASHIADASVPLSRFAVLGPARGGTGTSGASGAGGVARWTAGGVVATDDLAFDPTSGLRCPAIAFPGDNVAQASRTTLLYEAGVAGDADDGRVTVVSEGSAPPTTKSLALAAVMDPPVTLTAWATAGPPRGVTWEAFDRKGELAEVALVLYTVDGSPGTTPAVPAAADVFGDPAAVTVDISTPLNTKTRSGHIDVAAMGPTAATATHAAIAARCVRPEQTSPAVLVAL